MKKYLKNVITVITVLSMVFTMSFPVNAVIEIPAKVRIGLFFTDVKSKVNTAVSSFSVNAAKGLEIGTLKEGKFTMLFEEKSDNAVTIRKDSYFINTNGILTEYSPSQKPAQDSEKLGPYHVQIGGIYEKFELAKAEVELLRQKGIAAYPVYVDTWQVWAGFLTDEASTQAYIKNNLEPQIGDAIITVIQPSSNNIVVSNSVGEVVLLFGNNAGGLQVQPKAENDPYAFTINNKNSYRGDLEVKRLQGSDMTVVNVLPMDQYLYGVVPAEIGASSHPEALKAQAVAARTYTLAQLHKHSNLDFDLCTTTSCQVYKGLNNEDPRSNKAVDDTTGKKIVYNEKLAQVFYFSSSGGRTEDSKNVWGGDIPYLKSVEDKYESGKSWHYNWEVTLTSAKIKERMQQLGLNIGDILSVTVTKTSESGRAIELVIQGTKDRAVFTKEKCRTVFSLDSQWFNITTDAGIIVKGAGNTSSKTQLAGRKVLTASGEKVLTSGSGSSIMVIGADGTKKPVAMVPATYTFTGKGWGHAVGMSQEGARGMANAGFTYDKILKHYFTGVEVE